MKITETTWQPPAPQPIPAIMVSIASGDDLSEVIAHLLVLRDDLVDRGQVGSDYVLAGSEKVNGAPGSFGLGLYFTEVS